MLETKISSGLKKKKQFSGNDTVETPFFPFRLVQKGRLGERDKTVHAISG